MTEQNEAAPPPDAAPAAALDRPRLKKLVIHRYRHVKPGTTLVFDDTWNVIVGKNGTGKTTLLKLIEKLMDFNAEGLGRDSLSVDVEMTTGSGRVFTHIEWNCSPTRPANVLPGEDLDLKLEGEVRHGTVHARWARQPFSTTMTVDGGRVPAFNVRPYFPPQTLAEFLGGVASAWTFSARFDEALDYFNGVLSRNLERREADVDVILSGSAFMPVLKGEQLSERGANPHAPVSWGSDEDPVLRSFEALASVGRGVCTLPSKRVDVVDGVTTSIHGPPSFTFTRENGSSFGHNDLSFGQKRLLAFLYYLQKDDPILILDELSNGFHRNWIDYAVEQMQTRQNFAATQNPLLLDRIPFHSPEELQRSLIFCREEDGKFVWENAKADDMQEVYDAYDVGLEKVSDLLWRKGMW